MALGQVEILDRASSFFFSLPWIAHAFRSRAPVDAKWWWTATRTDRQGRVWVRAGFLCGHCGATRKGWSVSQTLELLAAESSQDGQRTYLVENKDGEDWVAASQHDVPTSLALA